MAAGRSEGNEHRRWHGTRRVCNLGDKGHTQFCSSTTCSLCSIIRTSYDISLWGKKTGWGRYIPFIMLVGLVSDGRFFKIWQGTLYVINIFKVGYLIAFRYWNADVFPRSNDYSHNDCKSSLKAILLNKVVVGKGCKLLHDNTNLTAPPAGFDSVSNFCSWTFDSILTQSTMVLGPRGKRRKLELRRAGRVLQRCYSPFFPRNVRTLAWFFFNHRNGGIISMWVLLGGMSSYTQVRVECNICIYPLLRLRFYYLTFNAHRYSRILSAPFHRRQIIISQFVHFSRYL